MTKETVTTTEIEHARRDWVSEHLAMYLKSGGTKGHVVDLREIGGHRFTPTLLLQTSGRKSGKSHVTPLIYGTLGGEVVIVASKGGADIHPAWYLNIKAGSEVSFQIATQAFRASWREPDGDERTALWAFMEKVYPPYTDYQASTSRNIPVVALRASEETEPFGL